MIELRMLDMDAETTRRINANYWSHKLGRSVLADKLGYQDTNYLNQLCGGHVDFGKRTARKFEAKLDLDHGWMDQPHPDLYPDDMPLSPELRHMANSFVAFKEIAALPEDQQERVMSYIRFLKSE